MKLVEKQILEGQINEAYLPIKDWAQASDLQKYLNGKNEREYITTGEIQNKMPTQIAKNIDDDAGFEVEILIDILKFLYPKKYK